MSASASRESIILVVNIIWNVTFRVQTHDAIENLDQSILFGLVITVGPFAEPNNRHFVDPSIYILSCHSYFPLRENDSHVFYFYHFVE